MGHYEPGSEYFVYEADEFDRNFLSFHPHLALITGIDWDHPDIYSTREAYNDAFREFLGQSSQAVLWQQDLDRLDLEASEQQSVLDEDDLAINEKLSLPGLVNRQNAWEAVQAMHKLTKKPLDELLKLVDKFPGVTRRFEQIVPGLYSDYAHTPAKIRGASATRPRSRG